MHNGILRRAGVKTILDGMPAILGGGFGAPPNGDFGFTVCVLMIFSFAFCPATISTAPRGIKGRS